jgi:nucleoside-diphosphate-sugar epimerase
LPLPFGSIHNARSIIYVENLVDALLVCAKAEHASGATFLVSDGEPVSTPELVRRLADALRRSPRLIPVPPSVLQGTARLLGKSGAAARLLGSFAVSNDAITHRLAWRPPTPMQAGLAATAAWFRAEQGLRG